MRFKVLAAFLTTTLLAATAAFGAGQYFEIEYPPSTKEGELQIGVTFTLWVPEGVKQIRGVIVHQHGCGEGACKGGETAAYDLHWQALAKKWDCALLGPSYHQSEKQNCRLWCDPRNGSHKVFVQSLTELATKSGHPEVAKVPWCLWGHSGGGYWASLMQTMYPDRIVAIWFRSGTAFSTWESGEVPKPELPESMYQIPMMANPGVKENGDKRFNGAWTGSLAMFKAYRAKGAPIGFAPDAKSGHDTGGSRYMAIPFFDACLAMRLPAKGSKDQKLKPVDMKTAWLAPLLGDQAEPAKAFKGDVKESVWLPNETVAKAWMEYTKTASTTDTTPPPAPTKVTVIGNEITWEAEADFESGIGGFIILRDGQEIAKLPEKPQARYNQAPLFQPLSFHDTPEKPLPAMKYVDASGTKGKYEVITVNSVGLKSKPVKAQK
jgi:hypothetical protein